MRPHIQADPTLLSKLAQIQRVCLAIVGLIAAVNLSGWLIPAVDPFLFHGWMLMKANTALLVLLSALSLALAQDHKSESSERTHRLGQLLGVLVFLMAAAVLVEYLWHVSLGVDTWLAPDAGTPQPGRMSPQTTTSLVLLGLTSAFLRVRRWKAARLVDFIAFCLCSFLLVIVAGYAFGVLHLFGISRSTLTSPQTLICLILLSFVAFASRAERGIYAIFVGGGVASKIARIAAPFSILVPFLLEASRLHFLNKGLFSEENSSALVTVLAAVAGMALVVTLAWRIESLEQGIRDLSIRDDLTKLYNRRGFLFLAERALQLARRAELPFTVLFFDLDNLKQVNDALGHDMGSNFICEMADLLQTSFRESDVIARIGGDEFVVAAASSHAGIHMAAQRLEKAAASRNLQEGHAYPLSFSYGHATSEFGRKESLEDLLNQADRAMYIAKRKKRKARDS